MPPSNTVAASQREHRRNFVLSQRAYREIYGEAAGKQADGADDRNIEHIARSRSADALSQIENVSDDKDDEDRRLRDNQAQRCPPDREKARSMMALAMWCDTVLIVSHIS